MAEIIVQKPAANAQKNIALHADDLLIFNFDTANTLLAREDDSLVITFEDKAKLTFIDFYAAYENDKLPKFSINKQIFLGKVFFAALHGMPTDYQEHSVNDTTQIANIDSAYTEKIISDTDENLFTYAGEEASMFEYPNTTSPSIYLHNADIDTINIDEVLRTEKDDKGVIETLTEKDKKR